MAFAHTRLFSTSNVRNVHRADGCRFVASAPLAIGLRVGQQPPGGAREDADMPPVGRDGHNDESQSVPQPAELS